MVLIATISETPEAIRDFPTGVAQLAHKPSHAHCTYPMRDSINLFFGSFCIFTYAKSVMIQIPKQIQKVIPFQLVNPQFIKEINISIYIGSPSVCSNRVLKAIESPMFVSRPASCFLKSPG